MAKRKAPAEGKSTQPRRRRSEPANYDVNTNHSAESENGQGKGHTADQSHHLSQPHPLSGPEFNARVARKAYELFERRGAGEGRDVEDWLEAERLVKEEILQEGGADHR